MTIEQRAIATIRGLSVDAPHAAKSGHQGTAVALAPLAHVLWTRHLRFDPTAPDWWDRDRFILSAGHASILLYSMLHLTGYDLTLDDLKAFRQLGSRTPGHPEAGHTFGVEVTTGPLGQGIANAVGMALAERRVRAQFGDDLSNHRIFAIVSDGDMFEGISHEAASLAGHQQLDRLVAIYDDNHITIDGSTAIATSDDTSARFEAYGWNVITLGDVAEDLDALDAGISEAVACSDKPTLIVLRSHIAEPSPTWTDKPAAHGLCFDDTSISELKALIGLPDEPFSVDPEVAEWYRTQGARGHRDHEAWKERVAASPRAAEFGEVTGLSVRAPLADLTAGIGEKAAATRVTSGAVLTALQPAMPSLVVGSADLSGNTGTKVPGDFITPQTPAGDQIAFGIREHAMGAALVGMALHGGVYPVAGTFLVFSDYMRPAVRLAALSGARCCFVWSHDSVAVGEDGPTHQPVEHVMSLRAIPNLAVFRPADAREVIASWDCALAHDGPSAMILSRQNVPLLDGTAVGAAEGVRRGAYLLQAATDPKVVIIGTGSEVSVAVTAAAELAADGIAATVVSMPCWELFEAQPASYRESVLPPGVPVVSVEAGVTLGWHRWADSPVGIDRFGASGPGDQVLESLGITPAAVVNAAQALI